MARKEQPRSKPHQDREARLKAALKANLARRKVQAKARQSDNKGPGSNKD